VDMPPMALVGACAFVCVDLVNGVCNYKLYVIA
jgi:hypothetical protein